MVNLLFLSMLIASVVAHPVPPLSLDRVRKHLKGWENWQKKNARPLPISAPRRPGKLARTRTATVGRRELYPQV
jgi:hypothetical protein